MDAPDSGERVVHFDKLQLNRREECFALRKHVRYLYRMKDESIVNVTEAQARLSKLIDQDTFAISRHGKIVGVYLSRDRIEALVESMELLGNSDFAVALEEYKSAQTKFHEIRELDKSMSK